MKGNEINASQWRDLVELSKDSKRVGYKFIFKTKCITMTISNDIGLNLLPKVSLRMMVLTTEIFSPISKNDSFKIIIVMVAHYDLKFHEINVKTAFQMEI